METIKKLIERVNNKTEPILHVRYPEILDVDRKNIVYVSPFFNKQGLYRMILPALELQLTGKYSTLVTNILDEDYTKTIDDSYFKIAPDIIRYADYMVFQATGQDMESLIMQIKGINPKCKIVMDIDRNYHTLNPNNYSSKKFNLEKIRNLEKNVQNVDLTTYPDWSTEDFYKKKCGPDIKTKIIPNLLSPFQFEGINSKEERTKSKDGKIKVLLMGDQDDWDDINSFRDTIDQVMIRVPNAKVYVLSNSLVFENKNCLRLVNYTRVPYTDMGEYYKIIWNMNPDMAIIPVKKQPFYRPYYKILELGMFGIPVVSMNEYPYNYLLNKDTQILLAGQKKTFVAGVNGICENEALRKQIAGNFEKHIRSMYSFLNKEMMNVYFDTFK